MVNKHAITYQVVFVPESGLESQGLVTITMKIVARVVEVELAIAAARSYLENQWIGERSPELYGPIYESALKSLDSLRRDDVYVLAIPVEYGALLIF